MVGPKAPRVCGRPQVLLQLTRLRTSNSRRLGAGHPMGLNCQHGLYPDRPPCHREQAKASVEAARAAEREAAEARAAALSAERDAAEVRPTHVPTRAAARAAQRPGRPYLFARTCHRLHCEPRARPSRGIRMHAHMSTHTPVHSSIHASIDTRPRIYRHTSTHVYGYAAKTYTRRRVCLFARLCTRPYTRPHTRPYTRLHTCLHTSVCALPHTGCASSRA